MGLKLRMIFLIQKNNQSALINIRYKNSTRVLQLKKNGYIFIAGKGIGCLTCFKPPEKSFFNLFLLRIQQSGIAFYSVSNYLNKLD